MSNPLESTEDKAVEDNLLDEETIEEYPESKIEGVEPHNQCFSDPNFPEVVKGNRGKTWPSSVPTIRSGRTQNG